MFRVLFMMLGFLDESASTVMIPSLPSCSRWESTTHEVEWVFCLCQSIKSFAVCAGPADTNGRFLEIYRERRLGTVPLLHLRLKLEAQ